MTAGPQDISYQMPSYQPPGYNSNASPLGQYYIYGTELVPTVPYDSPQNLPAQTSGYMYSSNSSYQNGLRQFMAITTMAIAETTALQWEEAKDRTTLDSG